jgi:hypothetical protein
MRYHLSWAAAVAAVSLAAGAAAPVFAQSLADVARQEAERRKTITEPVKVYTEKDLKPVPLPAASAAAPADGSAAADGSPADGSAPEAGAGASGADAAAAAAAGAASPADPTDKDNGAGTAADAAGGKSQADWAKGMKDRQDKLQRDQVLLESVQNRVNSLTTDFTNRDDPAQRDLIAQDRQRALDELDRLRKDLSADQQSISDYEDDARRAGVPAGWLRN